MPWRTNNPQAFSECFLNMKSPRFVLTLHSSLTFHVFASYFVHSRIAKNAMSMLKRFDVADQYPLFYLNYYGTVGSPGVLSLFKLG